MGGRFEFGLPVAQNGGMDTPSQQSRPPDTVYHGTDRKFDQFDLAGCLGAHFGTRKAAVDRLRSTGKLRIEYLPYRQPDGQWMVREQNWSNKEPFEHGPFACELDATGFMLHAPPHREPLQFEISVIRPLPLPDLGTWTFQIVLRHLEQQSIIIDGDGRIRTAWNRSNEKGWTALKDELARLGFDCVCYTNETEDPGSISWIVFDAERIHPKWRPGQSDNEPRFERERMRA